MRMRWSTVKASSLGRRPNLNYLLHCVTHSHCYHDNCCSSSILRTSPYSTVSTPVLAKKNKVVPYSITSVWHGADAGFLAVSPQVTLVINPVADCRYLLPSPRLLFQPKRLLPLAGAHTAWWQRHAGVSSLPKATMQWCPANIRTRHL